MNTTVWLITFTNSNGKQAQTVHAHNCVVDFRVIDPNATAQEIDCAAVAELIEAGNAWCDLMPGLAGGPEFDRLTAALANIGSAP